MKRRFTIVNDNSGHKYIIPVDMWADWFMFLEDEDACEPPEWATRIDGGRLTFTDWSIE